MRIEDKALQIKSDLLLLNKDIAVLTEDFDDNIFWKRTLEQVLTSQKLFFPLDQEGQTGRGILKKYEPFADNKLIICHDSDNEFLWSDKEPLTVPFIYETYVYSIENYNFDATALNDLIYSMTNIEFDISSSFLDTYNQYITPLFYWWIFFKKHGKDYGFNKVEQVRDLTKVDGIKASIQIEISKLKALDDLDTVLTELYDSIEKYMNLIHIEISEEQQTYFEKDTEAIKNELNNKYKIEQKDIVYFLQGHSVEEVFKPFLRQLISILQDDYIQEIKNKIPNPKKAERRIQKYKNDFESKNLDTKIRENYTYQFNYSNKYFQKILEAIKRDFSENNLFACNTKNLQ